ncbi:Sucrose synthase 2 [Populus alba x Populus x berolinensis]|uniref:sucrose synthase n=1 Tax=Populus alba x Populus x berolinensis TaxID=444605 RepID=A0AAD6RHS7_9ROSI|nr:Sucrose synthase 2 [Populus alba x Populus x berolinensis]
MRDRVQDTLSAHRNVLVSLLSRYVEQGKGILHPNNLIDELDNIVCDDAARLSLREGPFSEVLKAAHEAIVLPPFVAVSIRPRPGVWEFVRVDVSQLKVEELTVSEYLRFKEELVDGPTSHVSMTLFCLMTLMCLSLILSPSTAGFPRPTRSSSIGNGVQFLNRHLSSNMFRNKDTLEPLLDFLRVHKYKGHALMLNDRIKSVSRLQSALLKAEEYISKLPSETLYTEFEYTFQGMGFGERVGGYCSSGTGDDASSLGHTPSS